MICIHRQVFAYCFLPFSSITPSIKRVFGRDRGDSGRVASFGKMFLVILSSKSEGNRTHLSSQSSHRRCRRRRVHPPPPLRYPPPRAARRQLRRRRPTSHESRARHRRRWLIVALEKQKASRIFFSINPPFRKPPPLDERVAALAEDAGIGTCQLKRLRCTYRQLRIDRGVCVYGGRWWRAVHTPGKCQLLW
jgi:hypothetical protein